MQILDGKKVSEKIVEDLTREVFLIKKNIERIPRLDVILVGDDFGSIKYVNMKEKKAVEVGIDVKVHHLDEKTETEEVTKLIKSLNDDETVDGIMVQLPLPDQIDTNVVLETISPEKDVDGLTPTNLGKLFQGDKSAIAPATPIGIMELFKYYKINLSSKNVVLLGASEIVGKPLIAMLLNDHATVTVCNSYTKNAPDVCRQADILVSAVGIPLYVNKDFIKKDCIVIDVGSNKHPQTGQLVGDVDVEDVVDIVSYITPVPGGVGPMTIASLLLNLMHCYHGRQGNRRFN